MADTAPPPQWQIEFFTTASGRSPVTDYIAALPAAERAQISNVLRLLQEYGPRLPMPHARPLQRGLWELRPGPNRLLYVLAAGRTFIVVHAFHKQTGKTPKQEIETALKRAAQYQP